MGKLSKTKIDEIRKLRNEGYSKKEAANKVGVSIGSVRKYENKITSSEDVELNDQSPLKQFKSFEKNEELESEIQQLIEQYKSLQDEEIECGSTSRIQGSIKKCSKAIELLKKANDSDLQDIEKIITILKNEFKEKSGELCLSDKISKRLNQLNTLEEKLSNVMDKIIEFEKTKGVTLNEAMKFVKDNRELILDVKEYKKKENKLMKQIHFILENLIDLEKKYEALKQYNWVPYPEVAQCGNCFNWFDVAGIPHFTQITCPHCGCMLILDKTKIPHKPYIY